MARLTCASPTPQAAPEVLLVLISIPLNSEPKKVNVLADQLIPVGPINPVGPVGPVGPVEPVGPVGPVGPVDPVDPEDPEQLVPSFLQ